MLRYIADPVDAGGFEGRIGVEAAGHGPVDDGLLLLVQYLDQPPPIADEAADLPVKVTEKTNDQFLLVERWRT